MSDEIKIENKVTLPMNLVINWVLKGITSAVPKSFVYFFPKWKRKRMMDRMTGEDKNYPTPPSDDEIMNS